ncbi:hypothetical protein [Flavobacterium daemonense]|uniref:hypothetical protein n=1 Tax=Flavobacterium daemonense TaxID=1393049 RepID=UPI0011854F47|nr:hypothetical protein [Flavobacterium daemonense]KAF2337238.1 hypothetical protein FND99_02155 [Flavobacterium daemonense]
MTQSKGCSACKSSEPSNTQKINILKNFFPFLKNEFRELKETEIESEQVFKELFPDNESVDLGFLKAVFQFQQLSKAGK